MNVSGLLSRAFGDSRKTAFTLGLSTVVLTHTAMIMNLLPPDFHETQMRNHAALNLVAAGAIVYGVMR